MNAVVSKLRHSFILKLTHETDTGIRPYKCKECQRLFARQDSLFRHEKLHVKEANDYPSPSSTNSTHNPNFTLLGPDSSNGFHETDDHDSPSQPTPPHLSMFDIDTPAADPATASHNLQSADLDFDLMWPDTEDLFETLMAPDPTNPLQIPYSNSYPSPSQSGFSFGTPASIIDKASPMSSVCSGESHRAVHNVSEMVTNLVSDY